MEKTAIVKEYSNGEIIVRWEPALCTHSGRCIHSLPAVFDVRRRPWIDMRGADTQTIIRVVESCPSGALTWRKAE